MSDVQHLPAPKDTERVETGPVQFGNDWPGVFIRGDNAIIGFLPWLAHIHAHHGDDMDVFARMHLESLMSLLESCDVRREESRQ